MNLAHIVILARESSTMEAWTLPTGLLGKILDSVIRLVGRVQGITATLSVRSKVASVRSKQKIPHLWITSVGGVQATRELLPCPTALRMDASRYPSAKEIDSFSKDRLQRRPAIVRQPIQRSGKLRTEVADDRPLPDSRLRPGACRRVRRPS